MNNNDACRNDAYMGHKTEAVGRPMNAGFVAELAARGVLQGGTRFALELSL